jgi:hypothetical protein
MSELERHVYENQGPCGDQHQEQDGIGGLRAAGGV